MRRPHLPPLRGLPLITIHAGEVAVLREPAVVSTILGSCIAVTLFSRRLGAAAMCHAQYPGEGKKALPARKLYYTGPAVSHMVEQLLKLGADLSELEAKVFGGADVLRFGPSPEGASVGSRNLSAALEELARHGLAPKSRDVRGEAGRRVFFFTDTGEVLLRKVRKTTVLR